MGGDVVAIAQAPGEPQIGGQAADGAGRAEGEAVEPAGHLQQARIDVVQPKITVSTEQPRRASQPFEGGRGEGGIVHVHGAGDDHEIAQGAVGRGAGVDEREQPAHAVGQYRDLGFAAVGAHGRQRVGQQTQRVVAYAEGGVGAAGGAPVDQIDREAAGAQITDQTAFRQQVEDERARGQRRHQHDRRDVCLLGDRQGGVAQADAVFGQRRIVAHTHEAETMDDLVGRALGAEQVGVAAEPVGGVGQGGACGLACLTETPA